MAVQEQTPYIEHIANGVTTSFSLEFECKDKEHLIVLVDNVEPNVGTWSLVNGAVVFGIAPENGKIITIQRNTPFRRDTNFQSYDNSLRPATINKDFDWIWYKLQELGVADWILGSRIDALKNYVDDRDDELRAYLMEDIRKQGVALDQLDDYYNYLMQRLAQIAVDKGWDSSFVVDASGETQQQVNYNGGSKWHSRAGGYLKNERVILANGDIVKSTIDENTNDPNVDMTGWRLDDNTVESVADMLSIQNPKNGQVVFAKGYRKATNFALAKPFMGGGLFVFDINKVHISDGIINFNGWVRQFEKITSSMCGCYIDDKTDDRNIIQNAINVLSALNLPLHLDEGIHLVKETTLEQWSDASPFFKRSYIFDNRSNMSIIGNGVTTVIKYADGAAHVDCGAALFSSNPSVKLYDMYWDGVVIDQNGYNNKLEHNRALVQENQAITLHVGANATIKNCTFKDFTGMQVIFSRQMFDWDGGVTGADEPFQNISVTDNTFIDCGWLDGTNWSMSGMHDHSTVFLTGTYTAKNNFFIQNTKGMYAGTCFELHGKGDIIGNTVKGYANAFLSVGMYRDADNTIIGNWAYDCASLIYTDTHGTTKTFNNKITVIGNYLRQATFYIDESTVFGKNRVMCGITGWGLIGNVDIVIKGNVFETDGLYNGRANENTVKYNSVIQTQFFTSLTFEDNYIKGSKGSAVRIGKVSSHNLSAIKLRNNKFEGCGSGGLMDMGNSIYYIDNDNALDYGVKLDKIQSVGNEFFDCSYKYIMTTTVEAEGLMFPSKLECNDKFYGFLPYTLDHSATGDARQTTSFMFDVSCYNPVGNRTIYNRTGDAWFSYNQWGKFTIFSDKQKPSTYLKDGTMQDWLVSV